MSSELVVKTTVTWLPGPDFGECDACGERAQDSPRGFACVRGGQRGFALQVCQDCLRSIAAFASADGSPAEQLKRLEDERARVWSDLLLGQAAERGLVLMAIALNGRRPCLTPNGLEGQHRERIHVTGDGTWVCAFCGEP